MPRRIQLASLLAVLAAACGSEHGLDPLPPLPWPAEAMAPVAEPADNPSSAGKVALGRLLFYDPLLSSDRQVACATCHSELWGMSDGLDLSVGVDGEGPTGPGRSGPHRTTRNAQTLWNVGYRSSLFWDGRTSTLEEQALEPIAAEHEMNRNIDELVLDLRAIDAYRTLFSAAFPDDGEPVGAENLARALAAFQRGFVTSLAPYDRYVSGDLGALDHEARRGMFLFADAGCAQCHVPPLFESERFAHRDVPSADEGRFAVTGAEDDRGAFRVPTLRNLRETGPYFHDGSVVELREAVAHEARSLAMSDVDIDAIARFIHKGLMDRSREPDRPEQVPSGLDVPADGFRIPR
jgi:cytochrome c peroxidase